MQSQTHLCYMRHIYPSPDRETTMAKIVPPEGFKAWYFINASIYALQLTEKNQPAVLDALFNRLASGIVADINLSLANATDSTYTIRFREKTSSNELTLASPNYLVMRPDNTLVVLDEQTLRTEYTDVLEGGIYLDQGAVLRV